MLWDQKKIQACSCKWWVKTALKAMSSCQVKSEGVKKLLKQLEEPGLPAMDASERVIVKNTGSSYTIISWNCFSEVQQLVYTVHAQWYSSLLYPVYQEIVDHIREVAFNKRENYKYSKILGYIREVGLCREWPLRGDPSARIYHHFLTICTIFGAGFHGCVSEQTESVGYYDHYLKTTKCRVYNIVWVHRRIVTIYVPVYYFSEHEPSEKRFYILLQRDFKHFGVLRPKNMAG